MTNMSKDEKRMMLFDMQEHPEKYTDEQVERLLADEEVKEFFHELSMANLTTLALLASGIIATWALAITTSRISTTIMLVPWLDAM